MQKMESRLILNILGGSLSILCYLFLAVSVSAAVTYPIEAVFVSKSEANYSTPENAYISIMSAMVNDDVDWYYNSLTKESAENEIALYKKYNFDIQKEFDSVKNIRKIVILGKTPYKAGVFLTIKIIDNDGSILVGPSVFTMEDGLWKSMPEIPSDDPILDLVEYFPPPEHISPFSVLLHPDQFEIEWFNRIKGMIDGGKGPID